MTPQRPPSRPTRTFYGLSLILVLGLNLFGLVNVGGRNFLGWVVLLLGLLSGWFLWKSAHSPRAFQRASLLAAVAYITSLSAWFKGPTVVAPYSQQGNDTFLFVAGCFGVAVLLVIVVARLLLRLTSEETS